MKNEISKNFRLAVFSFRKQLFYATNPSYSTTVTVLYGIFFNNATDRCVFLSVTLQVS